MRFVEKGKSRVEIEVEHHESYLKLIPMLVAKGGLAQGEAEEEAAAHTKDLADLRDLVQAFSPLWARLCALSAELRFPGEDEAESVNDIEAL